NSRLPTTLNARDQPPAEVSDQRVSGLTGAVHRGVPAAIGCVPWLSSEAVAETLLALSAFCVVIDKGTSFPSRLRNPDKGFPNVALLRLRDMAPSEHGSRCSSARGRLCLSMS
ncbi:hypothetical protein AM77_00244, partial [Mycobacterium tuberculosis TKK_05SA_0055]